MGRSAVEVAHTPLWSSLWHFERWSARFRGRLSVALLARRIQFLQLLRSLRLFNLNINMPMPNLVNNLLNVNPPTPAAHLVFVSSCLGRFVAPCRSAEAAARFGANGFFQSLQAELAPHNVTVSMVYPSLRFNLTKSNNNNNNNLDLGSLILEHVLLRRGQRVVRRHVLEELAVPQ